jgi:UDP-sugar transporter A1/2/3
VPLHLPLPLPLSLPLPLPLPLPLSCPALPQDSAVFQVTYQIKILTTAFFSVVLLGRPLVWNQVLGLCILTGGVALVQLDISMNGNLEASAQSQNQFVGLLAVFGACCTSGFAGVYFELVLKKGPQPSVLVKNVQLSMLAMVMALTFGISKDFHAIQDKGFFQGYRAITWCVILFEAGGGLLVAVVIKYADNILKSFATAISIVTSTLLASYIFEFSVSRLFVFGCLCVIVAIHLYNCPNEAESNDGNRIEYSRVSLNEDNEDDIELPALPRAAEKL